MATFSKQLVDEICDRISKGETLTKICSTIKDHNGNRVLTFDVIRWLRSDQKRYKEFQVDYKEARQIQYEIMADQIFDICDDNSKDFVEATDRNGEPYMKFDNEHYQRSRLRVDTRKWFLSKVLPKIYGDKVHVDQSGTVEHTHQHTTADDIPFDKIAAKAGIKSVTKPETKH